jgi:hypothetical protein
MPWSPVGLWDVNNPTLFIQVVHRWAVRLSASCTGHSVLPRHVFISVCCSHVCWSPSIARRIREIDNSYSPNWVLNPRPSGLLRLRAGWMRRVLFTGMYVLPFGQLEVCWRSHWNMQTCFMSQSRKLRLTAEGIRCSVQHTHYFTGSSNQPI